MKKTITAILFSVLSFAGTTATAFEVELNTTKSTFTGNGAKIQFKGDSKKTLYPILAITGDQRDALDRSQQNALITNRLNAICQKMGWESASLLDDDFQVQDHSSSGPVVTLSENGQYQILTHGLHEEPALFDYITLVTMPMHLDYAQVFTKITCQK